VQIEPNSASLWLNLKSRLEQGITDSTPPKWRFLPNPDVSREKTEHEWFEFHQRHAAEIDEVCRDWASTGEIELEEPELLYQVCCRFVMANELVSKFTYIMNLRWTSPFPFPSGTVDDVMESLPIEWWYGVGLNWAFEMVYDDKLMSDL
jgi:hypothetical protein